jgi:hypothetical protein
MTSSVLAFDTKRRLPGKSDKLYWKFSIVAKKSKRIVEVYRQRKRRGLAVVKPGPLTLLLPTGVDR